ncbi:type IV toxin-antitoxin system AbiEi family antitoxin domain-containing protein [Nocardioidaceae bacterium]|nr:type IV toxin-antitoxin system AbiEi family antitoxin domain-containing protein [Nocardioidaceae bacterium]
MHIDLEIQAAARGGVFTRGEVLATGYTDDDIKHLVRSGDWRRVRRGRFVTSDAWNAADEVQRLAMRCHACVVTGRRCVLSHETAATLSHLPVVLPHAAPVDDDLIHLTVPTPRGSRPRVRSRAHVAAVPEHHRALAHGLVVTSPLRTALDLARRYGELTGVVAADAALNRGAQLDELRDMVEETAHWPGASHTRRLAELTDAGSQSPGETVSRLIVAALGLGPVTTQARIEHGNRHADVDLLLGRLVIEFDGRSKYGDLRRFGRDRTPEELLWDEKQREDWLRSLGYTVVRLTWSDLWPPRREATIRMLREKFFLAERAPV